MCTPYLPRHLARNPRKTGSTFHRAGNNIKVKACSRLILSKYTSILYTVSRKMRRENCSLIENRRESNSREMDAVKIDGGHTKNITGPSESKYNTSYYNTYRKNMKSGRLGLIYREGRWYFAPIFLLVIGPPVHIKVHTKFASKDKNITCTILHHI